MLQLLRQSTLLLYILLLTGCNGWFQPTAYFFISNISRDKEVVDMKVSIAAEEVFDDTLKYTGIQPDLSNTPSASLSKGKYIIKVSADNGRTTTKQRIDLGSDRWIFVSYSYKSAIDSAEAKASVTIYVMDKEPVHM